MSDARKLPRPAIIKGNTAYIPLGINAKDGYTLVDSDLYWLADEHKWTLDSGKRYAVTGTFYHDGKRKTLTYLHRVVMGLDSEGLVDHISRDRLDNRRNNLRLVDNRVNQINTDLRGGTSQYRGVIWDKRRGKWRARIKNYGTNIVLGYYDVEADAARAYNEAAIKHFGEYAKLNRMED